MGGENRIPSAAYDTDRRMHFRRNALSTFRRLGERKPGREAGGAR